MPDQTLQTLPINDFTPGIIRWSRTNVPPVYPLAPPGSASHAYRCWAKQNIGLLPLPSYQLAQTQSGTDATNPTCLSLGNMMTLAGRGGVVGDLVTAWLTIRGTGITPASTHFDIYRLPVNLITTAATFIYASSATGAFPQNTLTWPTMDYAVFQDPTTQAFSRVIITTDPVATANNTGNPGIWVTVRGWTTPTLTTAPEYSSGTFPLIGLIGSYPRLFYHGARMGIWQLGSAQTVTNHFVTSDSDQLSVSGLLVPTSITNAGTFFPEMGTFVGAWGSFSTGELLGIYQEGGAFIVYGDLFAPSSVYKLPGVMGTAGAIGKPALSPIGLIYPRLGEAVYLWNGDNVSQNISRQLPDGLFTRSHITNGFSDSPTTVTSTQSWGEWVCFPNNWMFDTATQSWWLLEDPNVLNFQVHCGDTTQSMFSSPGVAYAAAGQTATVNIYYWTKNSAVSNWFWQSNPLPVTISELVSIQRVEIIASNLTPTPATITITPSSPSGTIPLQNQNAAQPLVFTLPPQTANFRASHRLGYADYNVQLSVVANNPLSPAPSLHAINVSYTTTRSSGIQ